MDTYGTPGRQIGYLCVHSCVIAPTLSQSAPRCAGGRRAGEQHDEWRSRNPGESIGGLSQYMNFSVKDDPVMANPKATHQISGREEISFPVLRKWCRLVPQKFSGLFISTVSNF